MRGPWIVGTAGGRGVRRWSGSGNRTLYLRRLSYEALEARRLLATNVLHVDVDSLAPVPDGASWASAYVSLQAALDRAAVLNADGDAENDVAQIWIAEGTYIPTALSDADGNGSIDTDPRSATFSLLDGVSLYGGFVGTESTLDEREPAVNGVFPHERSSRAILAKTTRPTSPQRDLVTDATRQENAYTVVYARDLTQPTTLDGLTITGGNANASSHSYESPIRWGGGIYNRSSGTLTVANTTISANSAWSGGGICNHSGTMIVTNSTISGNLASGEPGVGGGIYLYAGAMTVTDSTVLGNSARSSGGGMYSSSGTLTVINSIVSDNSAVGDFGGGICNAGTLTVAGSTIAGNSANYEGGGICNDSATATISGSTISGNSASYGGGITNQIGARLTVSDSIISGNSAYSGGGIKNYIFSTLTVTNSTIAGNSATSYAGGIYHESGTLTVTGSTIVDNSADSAGGGISNCTSDLGTSTITNSIVAKNVADSHPDISASLAVESDYNLIGIWTGDSLPGGHNLTGTSSSPLDPHVGPLGDYGGPTWTMPLLPGSPAIDAGDPGVLDSSATDQRGFERIVDGDGDGVARMDIGAFEYVPAVLHVDVDSVAASPNGDTWASAYVSLQDALDHAAAINADDDAANDVPQIWIAEGTYIPTALSDADGNGAIDTDPRSATFSL